ncbi:MAG: conserved hypothetical protein [Methanobrevibacter sp. CfCl-M3]
MFNKKILFAVLIIAVLSATVGSVVGGQDVPNTVYVSPSGNDGNIGTSDAPFKTIKKAVEAVPNGGTVFIKAGLYYAKDGNGNIKFNINKDFNIVGEDKETTIIDGSDFKNTLNERGELVRSIIFGQYIGGSNETVKIKNLTFQNQVGYSAICIGSESTESTVENCNFINGRGTFNIDGGGCAVGSKAELKVLNCSFTNNSMGLATVMLRGGHYSTVAGSSFVDNRVEDGAALVLGEDALVSDSYFSGNIGGGDRYANDIYHCTTWGTIKLHNNVFIQSRDSSARSIWNEYGVTEYV